MEPQIIDHYNKTHYNKTLYNKTALKKIKKDDLIEMFLAQQARDYNSRMDGVEISKDKFLNFLKLKEELIQEKKESVEIMKENQRLRQTIRHQKDIIDETQQYLEDEQEELKTQLEEGTILNCHTTLKH